ncbi:hypothetical protein BDW60DRAFT_184322 [Aspergillus nidulans var. acristatus]
MLVGLEGAPTRRRLSSLLRSSLLSCCVSCWSYWRCSFRLAQTPVCIQCLSLGCLRVETSTAPAGSLHSTLNRHRPARSRISHNDLRSCGRTQGYFRETSSNH